MIGLVEANVLVCDGVVAELYCVMEGFGDVWLSSFMEIISSRYNFP